MLMLSGIQHFMFCPRQWALIHIEQQWAENKLTTEGQILHKNVDNPFYRQKNGDVITLRSLHIASKELGLYGVTDAVELIPADSSEDAITHNRYKGYWKPYPVEYKRGHHPDFGDFNISIAFKKEKSFIYRYFQVFSWVIWVTQKKVVYLHHVCTQKEK